MAEIYLLPEMPTIGQPSHPPKLLDSVRECLRVKHYSYRTEQAYVDWIRRYILFHAKRHPREMGGPEIERFLTHLAVNGNVSASTQTQALCALLFLYKYVLKIELPALDAVRAKRPKRLPIVLSQAEVRQLPSAVQGAQGAYRIMAGLMYGSGLRLMECCRLRVKDVDFVRRQLTIREAKGDKDRAVPLPASLSPGLRRQIAWRHDLHDADLSRGLGRVDLPTALERKLPAAAFELGWQFVFASDRISHCPRTNRPGRHQLHENAIAAAVTRAARAISLTKRVTCHSLRHSFATPPARIRQRHPHRAGTAWS